MFDNVTEYDYDARGESDASDDGEDGASRHRIARYREILNQDIHHDLYCDGEGGESGDEEEAIGEDEEVPVSYS
jgi:hypothetical protein